MVPANIVSLGLTCLIKNTESDDNDRRVLLVI